MTLPHNWARRLELPLIAAPMTAVSTPALAAAACRNGVIGSFPSHNASTVDELAAWLSAIDEELEPIRRTGMSPAPLAVNIVMHPSNRRRQADLDCALAHRVELLIGSVGNPAALVEPAHAAGCLVFADVATIRHVDRALAAGVDGLVLLTAGAGGQTGWLNPLAFLRAVRECYDGTVVLAGGIVDGTALWAAQTAGADLAYMGTKFISTTESGASDGYRQAVVAAGTDDIELTSKLTGLPTSIITRPTETAETGPDAPSSRSFDHARLLTAPTVFSAGHSVVGVNDIVDTATLIKRTTVEYLDARNHTLDMLTSPRGQTPMTTPQPHRGHSEIHTETSVKPAQPGAWHRIDSGSGQPLVLLHGGGSSSDSWRPVLDKLAAHRRVIALDMPGFGRTPAPPDIEYTVEWQVARLADELTRIGIDTPVDLVGNSMGGWLALEAAKLGLARSVVAIGPAGLWRHGMPLRMQTQFQLLLLGTWATRGTRRRMLRRPWLRRAALSLVVANPAHIPPEALIEIADTFDNSRSTLRPLLRTARRRGFRDGQSINVPVTIAYGTRERIVRPSNGQFRDQLPPNTCWIELPDCGHVPMSDNPDLITQTIFDGITPTHPPSRPA
jgi:nitronate monooxygenase